MCDREKEPRSGAEAFVERPTYEQFRALDIRVGTVIHAEPNKAARVPALIIRIDFGPELGVMISSAQISERYDAASIVGTQMVGVINFSVKRIAGVKSQVLLLAGVTDQGSVLLRPDQKVANGCRVY